MNAPEPFPVEIPFLHALGVELLEYSGGKATVALDSARMHQNSFEVVHGGVLMTLLDVAMAMAGRSLDDRDGEQRHGVVTIEMKTSFLRPARGRLVARSTCVHRTASLVFCEAEISDEAGHGVARGSGTFKYVRQRTIPGGPAAGR